MAALTVAAASNPAALAGVPAGANTNGGNSAAYSFTGGSGGVDTVTNADLKLGVDVNSRLYAFLDKNYATQVELDQTVAALGVIGSGSNVAGVRFVTAAPGKPTGSVATISIAGGALRIALAASISA